MKTVTINETEQKKTKKFTVVQRIVIFFWILSLNKEDLINIIIALSQRQANGKTYPKISNPYDKAREYAKNIPYLSRFIDDHTFPY